MKLNKRILVVLGLTIAVAGCSKKNGDDLSKSTSDCSISDVSFDTQVKPLIETHCVTGCHNSISFAGSISLEDYNEISPFVANGSLLGAISHDIGFSPMPKFALQLDSCDIKTIKVWIDEGTKNN